jgi:hypothetical protein
MLQVSHAELADAIREIEHRVGCVVSTLSYRKDGVLYCDVFQDHQHSQTVQILESSECVLAD